MGNEEIENVSEKEIENYFTGDAISLYMKEVFSYPLNSINDNKELARKYKNGDIEARDKMIKGNLRLVINVAYKYRDKISHLQLLDIIQEGNLGLIKAIEEYNPEIGAFSTYAIWWIKQAIWRAISNKEEEIRKPVYFDEKRKKYIALVSEYTKVGKNLPSDEEICKILDISLNLLKKIKEQASSVVVSINKEINDDKNTELGEMIADSRNDFNEVEDKIVQHQLFVILKEVLSPLEYYVIYYRILAPHQSTLESISSKLFITRERVRQIEVKALKKIKPYMDENSKKSINLYVKILKRERNYYNYINTEPIDPVKICKFMYVKDLLSEDECKILYFLYFGKYALPSKDIGDYLGYEDGDYKRYYTSLIIKIKEAFLDEEKFRIYRDELLKSYGTKIFKINLSKSINFVDYKFIKDRYASLTWNDIETKINDYQDEFNNDEKRLLEKFFKIKQVENINKSNLMKDINLSIFGLKEKRFILDKNKLWGIYQENINDFNMEQRLFLECYFFNTRKKEDFISTYKGSSLYYRYYYLIDRLERMYYNIYCYFEYNFSLEQYKEFRAKYKDSFSAKRIELLDLFYGYNGETYSISALALKYNIDYIKMHDMISDAREAAIILYCGYGNKLEIDKKKYIPYINNRIYEYTEETRTALLMYLIDNKDYDEISKVLGVSKYRLSNIITDGIRKIDNYRFGISKPLVITKEELDNYFKYYKDKISTLEKDILRLKYLKYKTNKDITLLLGISIGEVNKYSRRFNLLYYSYLIRDVEIEESDIIREVYRHPSESVLSDKEKQFASLYWGIKSIYNKEGIKYNQTEICKMLNITINSYYHLYREIVNNIKGLKKGIKEVPNLYIERDKLDVILEDSHLPLSQKEKDIICYLFQLKGYPYKTMDDLVNILEDNKGSIIRRYNRAIVSIYKYLNKEIEGKIDYEKDILPNMKYFSLSDRTIIEKYYKEGLTVNELATIYNLTFDKMSRIVGNIKVYLYDLLNNPKVKKFDFDYYLEVRNNKDIPFCGNKELAIKIFDLYYGMVGLYRLTIPEIINYLKLDMNNSAVNRVANNLMLCICKYKDGIRNNIPFSDEDIFKYYQEHANEMNYQHKLFYLRYLARIKKGGILNGISVKISNVILYDLLVDNYNVLSFEDLDRNKVIELLKNKGKMFSSTTRNELMALFSISGRDLMNGKDINHVYRILDKLYRLEYKMGINALLLKKD